MTIFAVLLPMPQPRLVEAIIRAFPNDHLQITDTQWLISAGGTVVELTAKLGIYDAADPTVPPTGNAIVFAVSAYHGRAPTTVWDWIKAQLERSAGG
jgi:hypothetical protein